MELKSLNDKKRSLDEAVKEYQSEADRYALEAKMKENMELLKMSNGLKRAAKEKQLQLDDIEVKYKMY